MLGEDLKIRNVTRDHCSIFVSGRVAGYDFAAQVLATHKNAMSAQPRTGIAIHYLSVTRDGFHEFLYDPEDGGGGIRARDRDIRSVVVYLRRGLISCAGMMEASLTRAIPRTADEPPLRFIYSLSRSGSSRASEDQKMQWQKAMCKYCDEVVQRNRQRLEQERKMGL
jgi:hypothetical protein